MLVLHFTAKGVFGCPVLRSVLFYTSVPQDRDEPRARPVQADRGAASGAPLLGDRLAVVLPVQCAVGPQTREREVQVHPGVCVCNRGGEGTTREHQRSPLKYSVVCTYVLGYNAALKHESLPSACERKNTSEKQGN